MRLFVPHRRAALRLAVFAAVALGALAALPARAQTAAPAADPLQVTVVTDQAEAVLDIAEKAARGERVSDEDWRRLFSSEGYVRLKARQTAMKRAMDDNAFRDFVLSPELRGRLPETRAAVEGWKRLDARAAARRAFAYLPMGSTIRARVYPVVKRETNSFVFEPRTDPAIFMYVDPAEPLPRVQNTLAHELHHIGFAGACASAPRHPDPRAQLARDWMGGFGEGLAVLAAAGGPDVHPHATSPGEERRVWERDLRNARRDAAALERFFLDLLSGRAADDEATTERGMRFVVSEGVPQGPFYTVGWALGATIERALGRPALVAALCDPAALLAAYNTAAARNPTRHAGDELAAWSPALLSGIALPAAPSAP